jgi:hypothetical protein
MTENPNSIWAIEIFGGADLGVIPLHDEPVLAIDDPLWELGSSTGAGAALCQKLEDNLSRVLLPLLQRPCPQAICQSC